MVDKSGAGRLGFRFLYFGVRVSVRWGSVVCVRRFVLRKTGKC